jgi:hypothetical protein
MRHLAELARSLDLAVEEAVLPMDGRARVLAAVPSPGPRGSSDSPGVATTS